MSNIYNTGSYFLHETLRYMMVVLIIIKLNFMFGLIFKKSIPVVKKLEL